MGVNRFNAVWRGERLSFFVGFVGEERGFNYFKLLM